MDSSESRISIGATSCRPGSHAEPSSTGTTTTTSQSTTTQNSSIALTAVASFLEDIQLHDIASTVKSRTVAALSDNAALRRLVESLAHAISVGDEKNRSTEPTTNWSNDDAEKLAVPVLEKILQSDQYIPRNKIKQIAQQLSATSPKFSSSSWLDGRSGYPRYRAPAARPIDRTEPERPSEPSILSKSQKTLSEIYHEMTDSKSPTSLSSWGSLADVPRSEEYMPKLPGLRDKDPFDPTDQYRDDNDPGYRIRDLWEADLIEEIQARERQDSETLRYPYFAAFVATPSSGYKIHQYPQYAANGHSQKSLEQQAMTPSITTDTSLRLSPKRKMTDHHTLSFHLKSTTTTTQGTPPRKSSVSSHSSSYVLNSTPPRSSTVGQISLNESPSSKERVEGLTTFTSPSLHSDVSQRCMSPTFGLPSPPSVVDADDELSGASFATHAEQKSASFGKVLSCSIENNDQDTLLLQSHSSNVQSLKDKTTAPEATESAHHPSHVPFVKQQHLKSSPSLSSPKSPVFGTDELEMPLPSDDLSKRSTEIRNDKKTNQLLDGSSPDELALCAPVDVPLIESTHEFPCTPSPACSSTDKKAELEHEDIQATLADARRWRNIYCDGNSELYRQRKIEERIVDDQVLVYPESGDPEFPLVDGNNKTIDCFNLKVIFERNKTGFEEYKDFQVKLGSVIAERYTVESQLGQAAFSKALRCYDRKAKQHVCMKVIRNDKDYVDQSLDEIKLLRYINCNGDVDMFHCLRLLDFFYYKEHLIIVTEMLKENLYEFSRKHRERGLTYFTIGRIQRVAAQVLVALQYVHSLRLIHSDLKPENILIKNPESCEVKVIDFGSSCFEDDLLSLYVQSRSYRAPEVLLGLPYDQKIDIWSLGCILAELWTGYVLFQNDSIAALLARIVGILGPIPYYMVCKGKNVSEHFTQDGQLFKVKTDEPACPRGGKRIRILLPKPSSLKQRMRTNDNVFIEFLSELLQLDPSKRPTASEALQHAWLKPGRYSDGLRG